MNHLPRRLLTLLAFALLCLGAAGAARADEVRVVGNVTGAFNGGPLSPAATLGGLTFSGADFSGTTSRGSLFFSLGRLTLGPTPASYSGNTFTLSINFSAPAGTAPNPFVVTGALSGNASNVALAFSLPSSPPLVTYVEQAFTFSDGAATGVFSLRIVRPLFVFPGSPNGCVAKIILGREESSIGFPQAAIWNRPATNFA